MGILNVTPDSFYAGSRKQTETEIAERTLQMSAEERKQLDIKYAKEFSFGMDMRIIIRTFTAFIQKENV